MQLPPTLKLSACIRDSDSEITYVHTYLLSRPYMYIAFETDDASNWSYVHESALGTHFLVKASRAKAHGPPIKLNDIQRYVRSTRSKSQRAGFDVVGYITSGKQLTALFRIN